MTLRVVTPADGSGAVTISWDHSRIAVPAATVVDVDPGSSLETAYGTTNLADLSGAALASAQDGGGGTGTGNG
jgi:hypothetical protein